MSGGSYNYLADQIRALHLGWGSQCSPELHRLMRDRLLELAPESRAARDFAAATEALERAFADLDRLYDVVHAVEWRDSGDWGPEDVEAAIAAYDTKRPERSEIVRDFLRALDVAAAEIAAADVVHQVERIEDVVQQLHRECARHGYEADEAALREYFRDRLAHHGVDRAIGSAA